MHRRCENPKSTSYNDYGAKGIRVCARWSDFKTFVKDMGPRPEGYTLDRIDPKGNYEPDNCRWANWKTQNLNRNMTIRKSQFGIHKHGLKYVFTFHGRRYSSYVYEDAVQMKMALYARKEG